jgi:hypothetical protein
MGACFVYLFIIYAVHMHDMPIYCFMRRDEMKAGKAMEVELEGRKKETEEGGAREQEDPNPLSCSTSASLQKPRRERTSRPVLAEAWLNAPSETYA